MAGAVYDERLRKIVMEGRGTDRTIHVQVPRIDERLEVGLNLTFPSRSAGDFSHSWHALHLFVARRIALLMHLQIPSGPMISLSHPPIPWSVAHSRFP